MINHNALLFEMLEGQKINQYHLEKLLGVGGLGGVFQACEVVQDNLLQPLAIKVIPKNSQEQLKELIAARNLEHQNLISYYLAEEGSIISKEFLYLVMELAEDSLENRLQQGIFNSSQTRQLIEEIASALVYLHRQQRVHQNLKPGNILQVRQEWKLSDFDLVRQLHSQSQINLSTIPYMPPEAFDGQITVDWDVWSLGIILVQMVTGQLPYNFDSSTQLLKQVINCSLQFPPLPKEFEQIIFGCLQPERQKRWTAQQVLEALTSRSEASFSSAIFPTLLGSNPSFSASSFMETLLGKVKLEMVEISGGEFYMGSSVEEAKRLAEKYKTNWYDSELPQHLVRISDFAIGKYPITQEQYQAVMGHNPSYFQKGGKYPVEKVSWEEAKEFCQKLSKLTAKEYRLPSEAEWEYACKAGTQTRYYFGEEESQLGEYAWYKDNSGNKTHPVGEKKQNRWGLHDMSGNVWEWCEDDWHDNYEGAPQDGKPWVEKDNPSRSKVLRGGSWYCFSWICRSTDRGKYVPKNWFNVHGFRVVC